MQTFSFAATQEVRRRRSVAIAILAALPLGGCFADSQASLYPDMLKQKAPERVVEQPPDVQAILKRDLGQIFVAGTHPSHISYSFPVPAKYGGWDTCIKASVVGAMGRGIGTQTYLVNIDSGKIERRERVEAGHWCGEQAYQAI